jgi:hypothetical protein
MPRPAALAVWRAAGEQDALDALFEWTTRLNHDFDAPEELEAMLGAWSEAEPEFRGSVVTEWIEAAAQESLDGRLTAAAFARLREASRHLHSMLNDESRMALLRRVRRWAAVSRETGGAPEAGFEATARSVLDLAPAAAVEVWENRVAGLLQASDGSRPLADATLCGAGAESAFRRIEGGDMDPLAGDGPSGFLPGLGVLTHLMPRRLAVEIHLPFAGRCDPLRRLETIRRATARPAPGGQIVLLAGEAGREAAERERYQNVLALAGSWRCAKSGVTPATYHLSAGTSGIVTDAASAGCWSRLLEFYGLPAPPYGAQSPARRHALSLSLPGELAAAWTTVPPERDAAFFPLFQAVSLAVQSALRFWLPALWLRDARRFGVKERALPLLIYTATEPFTPETRACLTYDLFDRDAVERAVRSGRRRLPALFNQVRASLEAAGQPKIAKLYDPDGCADIRTALRQRPRIFRSLLAAETFFVNQLTQLAVAGHHVRTLSLANPIRALKLTDEFSEHFAAVVQRKLFNLLGEEADFAPLGGVILLEATAALAGRRERLQATARIERGEETFLQVAQPRAR